MCIYLFVMFMCFSIFFCDYINMWWKKNKFYRFTIEKYSFTNQTHTESVKNQSLCYFMQHFQNLKYCVGTFSLLVCVIVDVVLFQASVEQKVPKEQLYKTVQSILDEIGYNRQLPVIRWLGLLLLKVLKRTCNGLCVNETSINRVSVYQNWLVLVLIRRCKGDSEMFLSFIFMHCLRHAVITSSFFLAGPHCVPNGCHVVLVFIISSSYWFGRACLPQQLPFSFQQGSFLCMRCLHMIAAWFLTCVSLQGTHKMKVEWTLLTVPMWIPGAEHESCHVRIFIVPHSGPRCMDM
jgi:hypothetical protein